MINAQSLTIKVINTTENTLPEIVEFSERTTPQLVYNGGDDRYQYMMPSQLNFTMEVSDAADLHFKHLFTGNESQYEVLLQNENEDVIWRGHLLPEQYQEPFEHARFFVSFTATDGLARLKEKYLTDAFFTQRHSVITIIRQCLNLTNLRLPLLFTAAIKNDYAQVGSNYNNIFIDMSTYQSSSGKKDNCYKILESLLETLGCCLLAYGDRWYITAHNLIAAQPFTSGPLVTYYKYDENGVPQGFESVNWASYKINLAATPQISLLPPYKRVVADWDIDERDSILPDDIVQQPAQTVGLWYNPAPLMYWESSAPLIRLGKYNLRPARQPDDYVPLFSQSGATLADAAVLAALEGDLYAGMALNLPSNSYNSIANNAGYYMQLETPVFLTNNNDTIGIELELVTVVDDYGNDTISQSEFQALYDADEYNNDRINYEILMDGVPFISNRPGFANREAYFLEFSQESDTRVRFDFNAKLVIGKLSLKDIPLPGDGEIQVRIYYTADPNAEMYVTATGVRQLSIAYSADEDHIYDVQRDIDWTTRYDVELSHGDSRMDILDSHFTLVETSQDINDYTEYATIGEKVLAFGFTTPQTLIDYIEVSQSVYNALQTAVNNGDQLYGIKSYSTSYQLIDSTVANMFQTRYNTTDGTQYYVRLEFVDGNAFSTSGGLYPAQDDQLFVYNGTPPQVIPRQWRDQWSRAGAGIEGRRFTELRAQMVQDTTPHPLVKIDSEVFNLHSPIGLKSFDIDGDKDFVVTNLTLNLDTGMSQMTLVESVQDQDIATQVFFNPTDV